MVEPFAKNLVTLYIGIEYDSLADLTIQTCKAVVNNSDVFLNAKKNWNKTLQGNKVDLLARRFEKRKNTHIISELEFNRMVIGKKPHLQLQIANRCLSDNFN